VGRSAVRLNWVVASALLLSAFCLLLIDNVGANPGVEIPDGQDEFDALLFLFLLNFPTDMLWFTAMTYLVLVRWGTEAGELPTNSSDFAIEVVLSSLGIAITGALTDLLAFYRYNPDWTVYFWPSSRDLLFSTSAVLAMTAIFVSVYLMSLWIMRLGYKQSIVPSVAMTAMNPVMWMITGGSWMGIQIVVAVIALVLAFLLLYRITVLHERTFPRIPVPE
jgi:hypothetical protein